MNDMWVDIIALIVVIVTIAIIINELGKIAV